MAIWTDHIVNVWTTVFFPKEEATTPFDASKVAYEYVKGCDVHRHDWEYEVTDWDDQWKVGIGAVLRVSALNDQWAMDEVHDRLIGGVVPTRDWDISVAE